MNIPEVIDSLSPVGEVSDQGHYWPDEVRLKMLNKGQFYEPNEKIYHYGYFDGFQHGYKMRSQALSSTEKEDVEEIKLAWEKSKAYAIELELSLLEARKFISENNHSDFWKTKQGKKINAPIQHLLYVENYDLYKPNPPKQ